MPKIRDTSTNEVIDVAATPSWVAGIWECGDQRFTDADGDLYEAVPDAAVPPKVSPVEFKLLFTAPERVAIKAARAADPVVDDFMSLVEDPRLTHVDLALQSTQAALGYLVANALLTEERRTEIIAGNVQ